MAKVIADFFGLMLVGLIGYGLGLIPVILDERAEKRKKHETDT